jgi:hypothetical protein
MTPREGERKRAANRENGITDVMVDQLLAGRDAVTVFESGGLVDELKKRLAQRMLNGEINHHLRTEVETEAGWRQRLTFSRKIFLQPAFSEGLHLQVWVLVRGATPARSRCS